MTSADAIPAASQNNANVTLLALLVDDNDDSEYRFLVDGRHVKYVTVAPGALPEDDRTFAPVLIPSLPPFPPGDWNEGHVIKNETTGELVFARTVRNDKLPGVQNAWHPVHVDHLELQPLSDGNGNGGGRRIQQNIHCVTHPTLFGGKGRTVVAKCAEFPWQMPYYEAETAAYAWIQGAGIGPQFLGHVTEAGRIIGFVIEYVAGARAAGPGDLPACQRTLAKLHALGIRHGDINRYNFLIRDTTAVLVDYESAQRSRTAEELTAEAELLASELQNESGRGGPGEVVVQGGQ